MSRADLLALSPESVAALANLGLVKRAQREIAAGEGPEISEDAAGVVTGTFKDGKVARLLPGKTLHETPCSCSAGTSVCRHRVAVALAYPAWHASQRPAPPASPDPALQASPAPPSAAEPWSPSCFSDADLQKALGKRTLERARALVRAGVVVEVEPGVIPAARLPTCAVRFHAPRDLTWARCDCATRADCEHVAVAAWAFRAAGDFEGGRRTIELGSGEGPAAVEVGALAEAEALAALVVVEGVAGLPPDLGPRFARVRHLLAAAGCIWPGALVDDLETSLEAYRAQSARYRASDVAERVASLAARARAVARGGELPARYLLGTDEARETDLYHVRLVSLGARVTADGDARDVEVYLGDPDSGTVLVLSRRYTFREGEEPQDGPSLAHRSIAARILLEKLARGQVVSKAVKRQANRAISLGSQLGKSDAVPQTGEWEIFPPSILATDFAALLRELDAAPPLLLRPRVLAEAMRVLAVHEVADVAYHPGEQQIVATLRDAEGEGIRLVRRHRRAAPHALDAIAAALQAPGLRFVAGDVRHGPFGLEVDPVGLVIAPPPDKPDAPGTVIVPDLEPSPGAPVEVEGGEERHASPLLSAIDTARSRLEEGCHLGLLRVRSDWIDRTREAAARLDEVGLGGAARRVRRLADAVRGLGDGAGADQARPAASAWMDAAIRLELTREAAVRG